MATISRFEEIEAWQLARELTNLVYAFTNTENFRHDFGLKDQIRRATVSIMSNLAEGFESQSQAQFLRYLGIAKASCAEVCSHLYVALDQKYITQAEFHKAYNLSNLTLRKIVRFSIYLESNAQARSVRDAEIAYLVPDTRLTE